MMRWILLTLLGVVAALGIAAYFTEPPRLLSILDGAMGGGRGTRQMGDGIAFGTTGQALDVWRPASRVGEPRPVIVFYYGGGWAHGDRGAYAFAARALASQGFVVVVPDYRKVPSVRFPAFVQDAAQAVKWTRDHVAEYGGDPGRIALAGHSAGAYNAVMLALDPRWLKAEGVDPRIVRAAIGLCGPYDFYPFNKPRSIEAMKGVADPQMTQPIHFARADAPPLLLVSAGNDVQVGAHNAVNLTARLKALGAPVTHIDHPGLRHENVVMALSKPYRDTAPVLSESVAFLNRALAPVAHR
ncbi:MAG: alpha/beta hydrolase [Pseudomonadota bacterium]